MKHFIFLTIFLSFFGMTNKAGANPSETSKQHDVIEKILKKGGISLNELGVYVAGPNGVVYENNSNKKFIPASLSKILTAIASFKVFAPEQRNITELRSVDPVKGELLDGPLYIQGHGDPSLISESMWVLVNNLARTGVKKIKGPLRVDASVFDENYFDDSRKDTRVDRAYDAPVSGLSFNWNTVNVYVSPTKVGKPLHVQIDPPSDYFKIVNKTTTVKGTKFPAIVIDKQKNKDGETLLISGSMGIKNGEAVKYASITYPHLWVAKNLVSFLKQRDIEVEDQSVEIVKVPSNTHLLSEAKGWTYYELIDGMMKYSNNFLAESLTKNIAVSRTGKQGSIKSGTEIIKEVLETNYGLKKSTYDFTSPSGFSNDNKITPHDLGLLMSKAYKDFTVSSYLLSTMAVPNHEGTLSRRMKSLKESRLLRAKTGLLSGVVGLAGYVANSKGDVFTFVFMYNGKGKESTARDLFDNAAMNITRL